MEPVRFEGRDFGWTLPSSSSQTLQDYSLPTVYICQRYFLGPL